MRVGVVRVRVGVVRVRVGVVRVHGSDEGGEYSIREYRARVIKVEGIGGVSGCGGEHRKQWKWRVGVKETEMMMVKGDMVKGDIGRTFTDPQCVCVCVYNCLTLQATMVCDWMFGRLVRILGINRCIVLGCSSLQI